MDGALLIARLVLAVVFVVAGVTKLVDRPGSRKAVADFGLPESLAAPVGILLPVVEIAIAVLLIPTQTAWAAAIAAAVLLLLFIIAITVNLARGNKVDCHCFGQVASGPIGWTTVARNAVLLAIAGLIIGAGRDNAGTSAYDWLGHLNTDEKIAIVLVAAVLVLLLGQWGFLVSLLQQNGRLLQKIDTLENALVALGNGESGAEALQAASAASSAPPPPVYGLPVGREAPAFALSGLFGEVVTLDLLRSHEKPVALLFMDPGCGPCNTLLPDVARWQRDNAADITVAIVSRGTPEANKAKMREHGIQNVLLQVGNEVADAYMAPGTPGAVIVDAGGTIATHVTAGPEPIRALVNSAIDGLPDVPARPAGSRQSQPVQPGPVIPLLDQAPAPIPQGSNGAASGALATGDRVPSIKLKDIDGKTMDLADLRGRKRLLVFWNTGCGFCRQMLPDLKEWERDKPADAPDIVLVSAGSLEDNRDLGLRSPVLLDTNFQVAQRFGASGTPMAVVIDEQGRVASGVAAGAPEVFALAVNGDGNAIGQGLDDDSSSSLQIGDEIPSMTLQDRDGKTVDLSGVRGRRSLLLFWNTGCGFCQQMLPDLKQWEATKSAESPDLVVISSGPLEDVRSMGLRSTVLHDPNFETGPEFGANGTPMGVLVDADGTVASAVGAGAPGVWQMLGGNPAGAAPSANGGAPAVVAKIGEPAPEIALSDLNGHTVNLEDYRGSDTLLIFWNTGCGFCQQLLPELKHWEQTKPKSAPRLLLVSTSSIDDNKAMGLKSTILHDPNFTVGGAFGAGGTPMAVLIDAQGNVASEVAAGGPAVMALAGAQSVNV